MNRDIGYFTNRYYKNNVYIDKYGCRYDNVLLFIVNGIFELPGSNISIMLNYFCDKLVNFNYDNANHCYYISIPEDNDYPSYMFFTYWLVRIGLAWYGSNIEKTWLNNDGVLLIRELIERKKNNEF